MKSEGSAVATPCSGTLAVLDVHTYLVLLCAVCAAFYVL